MQTLNKPQKILAVMFEMCKGEYKSLQYEDIVVECFKLYPEDFQLRGYPQYPDSSDIHKPLYKMKQQGLLRSARKTFELTSHGLEAAAKFTHSENQSKDRLTKLEENEINRILNSSAFKLFQEGRQDSILDTDFYEYLGVTVRTSRADCHGRLSIVEQAVAAHEKKRADALSLQLRAVHELLLSKFEKDIESRR